MSAKHSFIAVTTNFELEPVLDQPIQEASTSVTR
jgi:hypothetical protein